MNIRQKVSLLIISLFFLISNSVLAMTSELNAGLLKNIWYSQSSISEGDNIKILGGIYNQSTTTFSGVALTYVDNKEINREKFISKPDSLIELSSKWVAEKGKFSVQIKLGDIVFSDSSSASLQSTNTLLSGESDEVSISVNNKITLAEVKAKTQGIITEVIENIDEKANSLSDKILTLKKPIDEVEVQKINGDGKRDSVSENSGRLESDKGEVLGAETKFESVVNAGTDVLSKVKNSNFVTNIYNWLIDILSMIFVYWRITLFVIVALIIIFKFFI